MAKTQLLGLLALCICLPVAAAAVTAQAARPPATGTVIRVTMELEPSEPPPPMSCTSYPKDRLFIDEARRAYRDGEMRLVVPRMQLDCPVLANVQPETLERGVGLYDYAQLPSWGNPNVSIAGHRDIFGSPFLEIDKLCEGDNLYLVLRGSIYCYRWRETMVVVSTDWSQIHCDDSSRITLTSCDPVGSTRSRIIAVGQLEEIQPFTEAFVFT